MTYQQTKEFVLKHGLDIKDYLYDPFKKLFMVTWYGGERSYWSVIDA